MDMYPSYLHAEGTLNPQAYVRQSTDVTGESRIENPHTVSFEIVVSKFNSVQRRKEGKKSYWSEVPAFSTVNVSMKSGMLERVVLDLYRQPFSGTLLLLAKYINREGEKKRHSHI